VYHGHRRPELAFTSEKDAIRLRILYQVGLRRVRETAGAAAAAPLRFLRRDFPNVPR
jgi:hypothetical protein